MKFTQAQITMLEKEAKRATKGWKCGRQRVAYKKALLKRNKDNSWDGVYENMYRPRMEFISDERKILDRWNAQFHLAFPGRVKIAVRERYGN